MRLAALLSAVLLSAVLTSPAVAQTAGQAAAPATPTGRLEIADPAWGLYAGASAPLAARLVLPDGSVRDVQGDVQWRSSDPGAAWVTADGHATFFKTGRITVTVSVDSLSASREIEVQSNPVRSVAIGLDGLRELKAGEPLRLLPRALGRDDESIPDAFVNLGLSWADTALAVRGARIDDRVFVADVPGVYLVVAEFGGRADLATIVVNPPEPPRPNVPSARDVNIDGPDFDPYVGTIMPLSARVRLPRENDPLDGAVVTWTSSNPERAVVASNGTVVFLDDGRVTITAEAGGRRGTKGFNVQRNPAARIVIMSNAREIFPGDEVRLRTEVWARGGQPVRSARINYAVVSGGKPETDAVVSEEGVFVAARPGVYTIIGEIAGLADKVTLTVQSPNW
jgi:hypothetical protein